MDRTSVLIVEDETDLREIYRMHLQEQVDVETAANGTEALSTVSDDIDVVLLDRRLPDMSGDEVLQRMRDRGIDVPVAIVTGVDPDVDIVDMPFDEYLTKPVERNDLLNTVRVLTSRATFEEKAREFFSLASKKSSLEAKPSVPDTGEYDALIERMTAVRDDLDKTVNNLFQSNAAFRSRFVPDAEEKHSLLEDVNDHSLPEPLHTLIEDYQALRNARPPFMWKWVHRLAPQNELPCVDAEHTERVAIDKTLIILYITLLDDTLEKHNDCATFHALADIPVASETWREEPSSPFVMAGEVSDSQSDWETASTLDTEYTAFAQRVWHTFMERLREAPKYDMYADLFLYDIKQAILGLEYSDIAIRRPDLSTMGDLERYESHNMVMFGYADVDLMHSSVEVRDDLPSLRDAIWTAQQMARIGNWVSTWERELREGDYSSGPVVYALDSGIVTSDELEASADNADLQEALVDRLKNHGVQEEFLSRWERCHYELRRYNDELTSIDLDAFISGTEEVLRYHLASTGLK